MAFGRVTQEAYLDRGFNSYGAMQFLNSAWLLSGSGAVANRLGQVYEKQGQADKARHMYALATAAGGATATDSRERLTKLVADAAASQKEIDEATFEANAQTIFDQAENRLHCQKAIITWLVS